jgi:hypothetical protein
MLNRKHLSFPLHGSRLSLSAIPEIFVKSPMLRRKDQLLRLARLFNTVTKAVTIANSKAWMDAVTLVMWVEVQIKELFGGAKKLLVVDNCPSHTVEAVKAVFAENNIILKFLPKNMTDRLQPMDLVVNGPLKASIKSARGLPLYNSLVNWKLEYEIAELRQEITPVSNPPKVELHDGLGIILDKVAEDFEVYEFKASLVKCFERVGLAKDTRVSPHAYLRYFSHDAKLTGMYQLVTPCDGEFMMDDLVFDVNLEQRQDSLGIEAETNVDEFDEDAENDDDDDDEE